MRYITLLLLIFLYSCQKKKNKQIETTSPIVKKDSIFTKYSKDTTKIGDFTPSSAVNKIAKIENEYFNDYKKGYSRYYGTEWRKKYSWIPINNDTTEAWQDYNKNIESTKDSMHCTIYAIKALKAGFGEEFEKIDSLHKSIWKDREYAGWSIAYILTKYYNWKAYLIISKNSEEYQRCKTTFKKSKSYYVWKQPNISIEAILDFENNKKEINNLLNKHEFTWGFSFQGWHTWICRRNVLKECNWNGVPSIKYQTDINKELFLKTKFTEYYDYKSHIVVFPH